MGEKRKIIFTSSQETITVEVEFLDNPAAKTIEKNLPQESRVNLWGEEIYFGLGIKVEGINATLDVEIGDIAYWPQGRCLCVFFGPTPLSSSSKPVPASEVVVIGKLLSPISSLKKIKRGWKVKVE